MSKIKWIIFDVSGVLTHFTFTNPNGYRVKNKHIESKKLESIYFTKEYKDYMLGHLSHSDFLTTFLQKNDIDLNVEEFNKIFDDDLRPIQGIKDLISKMSAKYKIALATNEGDILSRYRIEKANIRVFIQEIISSYKIKELKPSIEFFKKMLMILKAKPEECIFIDDDKKNINAVHQLNINSILFKNSEELENEFKALKII